MNKLRWHFNQNTKLIIHENASENIVCEMVAILSSERWVNTFNKMTHFLQMTSTQYTSLSENYPISIKTLRIFLRVQRGQLGFSPRLCG